MSENTKITVAYGDGIGPEIMEATLNILRAAGARLSFETIEIGEKLYHKGFSSGISNEALATIKANKILLKAPITTPQGKGYKSLNVTFRKALGLYANIRPIVSYYPSIKSPHQKMDIVIVRENEEDLYSGIEYRATSNTSIAYKVISRMGCEKIIRYAFEYARINNRRKVTCVSKDNIMKVTDGMFHVLFDEIAKEYTEIKTDHAIVDIGAARIAAKPENFDVVVTLNLYGDIISDIAAEISGSVGLAGSSNIGEKYAMFEAIHGSAPDIAGQNIANPSGLLNSAVLMLEYLGQYDVAMKIQNAWLSTIEEGIHTADIYDEKLSRKKVTTQAFTEAVIFNLGKEPEILPKAVKKEKKEIRTPKALPIEQDQEMIGLDIYIRYNGGLDMLVEKTKSADRKFELSHIALRGIKVWPNIEVESLSSDLWRLRYIKADKDTKLTYTDLISLQSQIAKAKLEIALTNTLYTFNGMAGFTQAQGE